MDVCSNTNSCITKIQQRGFLSRFLARDPNCFPSEWLFAPAVLAEGRGSLESTKDPTLLMLRFTPLSKVPPLLFWNPNKHLNRSP